MPDDERLRQTMMAAVDEETMQRAQTVSKEFAKLIVYYKCAMLEVQTRFTVLNEEFALEHGRTPVNSIKTRLKTLPSIREKMERRSIPFSFEAMEEELHDIAGVRVICAFPEDVNTMAHAFLKQDDVVLLQKKDYITKPKPNGYRSLHLIIAIPVYLADGKRMTKVEIQIRTIAMDFWASLEHQLRYKKNIEHTEEIAKELYECAQLSAALDNRMDDLRRNIYAYNNPTESDS